MANYYAVFASGLKSCDLRWVGYTDIVTGTELLAGCLPIFEITSSATTCGGGGPGRSSHSGTVTLYISSVIPHTNYTG